MNTNTRSPHETHVKWSKEEMRAVIRQHIKLTGGVTFNAAHILKAQEILPAERRKVCPRTPLPENLDRMMNEGSWGDVPNGHDKDSTASLMAAETRFADMRAPKVEPNGDETRFASSFPETKLGGPIQPLRPCESRAPLTAPRAVFADPGAIVVQPIPMPKVAPPAADDSELLEHLVNINRGILALYEVSAATLIRLSPMQRGRLRNLAVQACDSLSRFEELLSL